MGNPGWGEKISRWEEMKTLGQIVAELENSSSAYKFSVTAAGQAKLSVDGLMGSLLRMGV